MAGRDETNDRDGPEVPGFEEEGLDLDAGCPASFCLLVTRGMVIEFDGCYGE